MAYVRQIPSGKWQATVRHPSGKRITRTDRLRRVVTDWARDEEGRIARGEWRDPKTGRVNFPDWRDRWLAARVVEPTTMRGDLGILRNHINPKWDTWRLAAISRLEVQGWVRAMQQAGVGAATIRRAYNLLSSILAAAVDEGLLNETPCRRIDLPATPAKQPEWFTPEQVAAIRQHLPERHSIAVELMVWCGLRWGEMAGLRVCDIDWLRQRVKVVGAALQSGEWKEYPKSAKSRRELPVPAHVMLLLSPLAAGRRAEDRLFVTERPYKGQHRPWSGSNWRDVFNAAVKAAGAPPYSPHALRHSAASWLVQDGVPIYDVQAFLGHESTQTTQRYAHLRPDAHSSIETAWATRLATHHKRTAQGRTAEDGA